MKTAITLLTDKNKLDIVFLHSFLSKTYWAKGRTLEQMKVLVDNSLNFGVYLDDVQIGYARLVTDYAQFAYLMDVFITEEHRGKGYSKQLMDFMVNHPELNEVKIWRLASSDAQKLYEQFGFKPLKNPEKLMELIK